MNEYKREAFELFEAMLANLRQHVTSVLSHVELRVQPAPPAYAMAGPEPDEAMAEEVRATGTAGRPVAPQPRTQRRGNGADHGGPRLAGPAAPWARTPRNASCPCGSGKKYKHCHGRV